MRRREFIASLGGAAVWPLVAHGQQADRVRRIGVLFTLQKDDPFARQQVQALLQGLQAAGWNVGADLQVDFRFSGGNDRAQIQAVAKGLVATQPDVIQVSTTPGTAAILMETREIPVVFTVVSDPIGSGFVENFSHPGGNATGFVNIEASMGGKWVQILKEIAPHVSRVTLLFNPATGPQANYYRGPVEAAARALSISSRAAPVGDVAAIEAEIIATAREPDAGLIAFSDIFVFNHRDLIVSLANRARLPTVYPFSEAARAGGSSPMEWIIWTSSDAQLVTLILKGAKPANLPVQLPTKFDFVINLKTARALDLSVPAGLLATADEVIE
jgi:putative tryptophan/tyrosine transport system substrate-binding protein